MKERVLTPTIDHEVLYQDLCALLEKHRSKHANTEEIMLAIASQIVGKVMALQDQRTMTPDRAIAIVKANVEAGNAQIIDELRDTTPKGRA